MNVIVAPSIADGKMLLSDPEGPLSYIYNKVAIRGYITRLMFIYKKYDYSDGTMSSRRANLFMLNLSSAFVCFKTILPIMGRMRISSTYSTTTVWCEYVDMLLHFPKYVIESKLP